MLDHLFFSWGWRATALCICLFPFLVAYLLTTVKSTLTVRSKSTNKSPAFDPSPDFIFGNLFAFSFDTRGYLAHLINRFGPHVPVRIRVGGHSFYFVSGPEYILKLFRGSRELTAVPAMAAIVERIFGSPPEASSVLLNDNTGTSAQPLPDTNPLPADQRYHHLSHQGFSDNLTGVRLAELVTRFLENLNTELDNLDTGTDEWLEIPDLYTFIQNTIFNANTRALCGTHIFEVIPTLTEDFWNFDSQVAGPLKGIPRFFIPGAYKIRDKMVEGILAWHKSAEAHIDRSGEELENKSWEPYYGSKLFRDRARFLSKINGFGDQARAANDLGLIWGANSNSIPAIAWCILDILYRPDLLSQIHSELSTIATLHQNSPITQQTPDLLSNLLLQSIYSEELRLRNAAAIQRSTLNPTFRIGPWKFPKNAMILASIWYAGHDKTIWNEGPNNQYDVDTFWPERFILYPNNPHSGPKKQHNTDKHPSEKITNPKLITDAVNGSWIPYGGGQQICPGRFYAKQEVIGSIAVFFSRLEVELLGVRDGEMPMPDFRYFSLGVLPPKGRFPARLRRR
ncbi:81f82b88-dd2c-49ed-b7e7-e04fa06feb2e [Sclerotinia trifoliorum]|uniref:81f82b88-dd2c-49ed-b7e7-e04fa06feb2e n=1 Tax=Sclerotinia trifoliorum TaxID=28548 RepID=A0A8H2ZSM5_9HELO|nr:81f82b88-dd2c-49ed-b7e7-e04fa06feb2e [Sclerotinia trifoliorum]